MVGMNINPRFLNAHCLLAMTAGSLVAVAASGAAAPPPAVGQLLASQCFQCHSNVPGQRGGFESITGKEAKEIVKKMQEMKSKSVPENIMERHAKGYTDAQLQQLATYLATLPSDDTE